VAYLRSAARQPGTPAVAHVQRKINLPTYKLFREGEWFEPGPDFDVFTLEGIRAQAAVLICADAWSQGLAYAAALKGAEVLFHVAASPLGALGDTLDSKTSWQRLNQTYACLLSAYVVFVNRVGREESLVFWGGSEVIDPRGKRLTRAPYRRESLRVVELDLALVRRQRENLPMLRQERWDRTVKILETLRPV
jgi:predicted amidohydrolase